MLRLDDYQPTDLAHATTLPSRWYLDPEFLGAETESIFWRSWQWVGASAKVRNPGDFNTHDLLGEPLVLVRGKDEELRGFYNVCKHRAGPVAVGSGNKPALLCPYHGWTYGLDGCLRRAREFEDVADFDPKEVKLDGVRVSEWGPLVLANLDPEAPSLNDMLGEIPDEVAEAGFAIDRMELVERRDYEVKANWKVYVDNYLEGYHIPIAHPGLYRTIDYAAYRVETRRWHSRQHAPFRKGRETKALEGRDRRYLRAEGEEQALYYWVFPNLMLNLYPDNLQINVVVPLDHERTLTVFEWYALPDLSEERRDGVETAISFSDEIQHEDIEVCEWVQERLGSRAYDKGRLSVKRENGVHHFHQLVHECLQGAAG
ncbi:MAG: aromatic ring-hydroxylating dioxygenase subunit alpha [Acidobacteriota bacterium]